MTDRDDTTATATRLNAELLAMVRIASTILQYTKLDDILAAITRELSHLIEFDRSSVALLAPDNQSLILKHVYCRGCKEPETEGRLIALNDRTLQGWVCQNRRAVLRPDVAADARFADVKDDQAGSDMVAPLVARGRVIGTLNVGCKAANALGDTDLEKLVNCANIASGAIEHAILLEEAKDLGERYRTLQRNASDIIMLIDRNTGRLVEVNRQCCEVLGCKEDDLLRRSYFDLFHTEDQFQARRDFVNIMSGKARSFVDRRLVGRDGTAIFVDISASLIDLKSDTFIQVLVHDISQRKMLEQQIILQNKNLQDANRRLREVDEMKTEFLANISHELRTPLSVIIAYTEALRDGMVGGEEDRKHFLEVVADNSQSLLRLINDLLDLSKLEVSGTMLSFTLSHIHDVIRVLWPKVEAAAEQRGIEVSFKPGYEIPVVYIDNKRIGQVVMSLATNAVKFTEKGGKVEVSTRRTDAGVVIQVTDTGAGIPEEQIASVFDTFRQLDGSTTRRVGGLGIGLAIAKHIIELHGGKIWVESKAGVGSTFAFMIPVETEEVSRTSSESSEALSRIVPANVPSLDAWIDSHLGDTGPVV